jgi:hypothetical protein
MPGKGLAVANGDELVRAVAELAQNLGLEWRKQVRVARRIWGAIRHIDVVITHPQTRKTLGIECKFQSVTGTAEEKIPSVINDIAAWPIPGLVVFAGAGFTENMKLFLISTGKAVEFEDLAPWLRLFFGLPLDQVTPVERTPDLL